MVKQSLVQTKQNFKAFITADGVKNRINQVIGSKDGQRFITAITSVVSNNPDLADCDHNTILNAAMVGEALKLSPSPQLGQYYIVPFKDNKHGRKVATFILGYKGYIQLAVRSGQYKKLNVVAIKEDELKSYNPLDEEIEVNLIENEEQREQAKTIGYYAMFEYTNGFKKTLYWSRAKMEAHALKYSKGYDAKKGYTFWEKDFDGMAFKTMLRQLIGKWGIMSIDIQKGLENDGAVIADDGTTTYVEADFEPVTTPEQNTPVVNLAAEERPREEGTPEVFPSPEDDPFFNQETNS